MSTIQAIISTPDLPKLQRFYETVLGAEETDRYPEDGDTFFVNLRIGDSTLGLVSEADTEPHGPGQRMVISVAVDDVDALLDVVTAAGGTLFGPPNDMPWGQRVGHVYDPDGNMVNLTTSITAQA